MDTNHITSKSSDTDEKPPEQSISTPPPSKKKYDIMKDPIFLTSPVYPAVISPKDSIQHKEMITSYRFFRLKISRSNLNSHLYICTQLTAPSKYMTKTKTSLLLLPRT